MNNYVYVKNTIRFLPTPTLSVGVGRAFESVCLLVCLFVCPQHKSKTNDSKVFKLGIGNGNDLGISYKFHGFGVERSKVKVRLELWLTAIRRGFDTSAF